MTSENLNVPFLILKMKFFKETKNAFVYAEVVPDEFSAPAIRTLYLSKVSCHAWGARPNTLQVTLTPIGHFNPGGTK